MAGSVWKRPGLEESVWHKGEDVPAFGVWGKSTHCPELAQLTEDRVLEISVISESPIPYDTNGETEAQEGTDLPGVLQLVEGRAKIQTWGAGTLGFSSQLCPIPASYCIFLQKGDKNWVVVRIQIYISRTQGLATASN